MTSPCKEDNSIILRKILLEDAENLRYLFGYPLSLSAAEQMIMNFQKEEKEIILGIALKQSNCIAGVIELYNLKEYDADVGYRMIPKHQGKHIMVQALSTLKEYLKDYEIHVLYACISKDNIASMHILENNGYQRINETDAEIQYRFILK